MRALKKTILFSVCAMMIFQFCNQQTDGFSIQKISCRLSPSAECTVVPSGTFTYLGKGAQTFAFVSDDGTKVLKFYRQNRASHPLAWLHPFSPQLQKTLGKRRAKREKDLASFLLAETHLAKETGLLSLHLGKTSRPISVVLIDKIGIHHKVDLSQLQWIYQEYATPVYSQLATWIEERQQELAKEQLTALVALIKQRCTKGLFDKDPDLQTNFGFTPNGPIQFDIGRFSVDAHRKEARIYREDLIRITDALTHWLEKRDKDLADHLKEEVGRV